MIKDIQMIIHFNLIEQKLKYECYFQKKRPDRRSLQVFQFCWLIEVGEITGETAEAEAEDHGNTSRLGTLGEGWKLEVGDHLHYFTLFCQSFGSF